MKTMILFDTNFLFSEELSKEVIGNLEKHNVHCYISEIIVDEMKGINTRRIFADYEEIKKTIKKSKYTAYFQISDSTKKDRFESKIDEDVDAYLRDLFGTNIIKIANKDKYLNLLMERSKFKKPPFNKNRSGDNGFKDTLIWISFVEFAKNNAFEKYILVTADGDYLNNKKELIAEFEENVNNSKISIENYNRIEDLYKAFNINAGGKKGIEIPKDEPNNNKRSFAFGKEFEMLELNSEEVEDTKKSIDNILYSEGEGLYGAYKQGNFIFYNSLSSDMIEGFCSLLSIEFEKLLFFDDYDLKDIFERVDISADTVSPVSINSLGKFVDSYRKIIKIGGLLEKAFFKYLEYSLNLMVKEVNDNNLTSDDLPF